MIIGGVVGPVILTILAVFLPAAGARVVGRLVRTSLTFSLPLALSALIVNV